jgi:glutamate-1-semialdehyde 2,1-aminomutase
MSSGSRYKESAALLERSKKVLAGGVASEFRKFNYPHALFYTHGKGSRIYDADGNEYLDFTLSQGPLILGHSHPQVLESINNYSAKGQLFAGQHLQEIQLAEKIQELIPSAEKMRFCLDGSEAVQTAFRVARATTGRQKILRFEGHYHGWLDNVCWGNAAPSLISLGEREYPSLTPWTQGLPSNTRDEIITLPWNDLALVKKILDEKGHEIAALITEPVMCNNGCIPPVEGYLEGLRKLCDDHGIALIFDEVITGFRIGLRGAQTYYNVIPDLSIFAKAMASGYPLSVIAGKQKWMQVIEEGKVIHAGTMNSGNAPVAAALATLKVLEEKDPYENMYALGKELMQGLEKIATDKDLPLLVQGLGPVFHTGFTNLKRVTEYRDTFSYDKTMLHKFIAGMHDKGIRIIGRGLWYISAAHTSAEIEYTLQKAHEVLGNMN